MSAVRTKCFFSGSSCRLRLHSRCNLRSGMSQNVTLHPVVAAQQLVLHCVCIQPWSSAHTDVVFCPTQQQRRIDSRALCTCCARPWRALATNLARWWPTLQPNTWEGSMGVDSSRRYAANNSPCAIWTSYDVTKGGTGKNSTEVNWDHVFLSCFTCQVI